MFAQHIQLEYISFFEPREGVWREEAVGKPTDDATNRCQDHDEEDFLDFCRRSLA